MVLSTSVLPVLLSLLLSLRLVVSQHPGQQIPLCCLCENCGPPVSSRRDMFVNADGLTCNALVLEMADPMGPYYNLGLDQPTSKCYNAVNTHYDRCCNANSNPVEIVQNAPNGGNGWPQGEHPPCNLCHDGGPPGKPNTVTATLQIPGNPTCDDLYEMGKAGHITDQICNPLQDFYHIPCGCDVRENGGGGGNGSNGGGSNGGGGGSNGGGSAPGGGGTENAIPPKKTASTRGNKDSAKLSSGRVRGGTNVRRGRRLKGAETANL